MVLFRSFYIPVSFSSEKNLHVILIIIWRIFLIHFHIQLHPLNHLLFTNITDIANSVMISLTSKHLDNCINCVCLILLYLKIKLHIVTTPFLPCIISTRISCASYQQVNSLSNWNILCMSRCSLLKLFNIFFLTRLFNQMRNTCG